MYKTLQLFTNTFTFNTNKFTSIEVNKNAKTIKAWIKLKLFIDLGLMKSRLLGADIFKVIFLLVQNVV